MAGYDDFAKLLDEQAPPATDPNVARAREKGSPPRFPVETTEDAARAARRQKGVLDAELQADEPHTRTEDFAREYGRALDRTRSTPDAPEPKKPAGDFEAGMEFFTALSGGKEVPAKGAAQQNYDPFSGNSNMPGDAIEQPESAPRAPRALEVDRRPMEERPARAVLGPGGKRTVMVKSGEDGDFNLAEHQAPYLGDGGVFTNAPAGMVAASKNAAANLARQWQGDVAMQNRAMGTGSGDVVGYSASPMFARYQDAARQRTQIALDQATKAGEQMKQWADQTKREMELVTPRGMSTFQQAIWSTVQSAPPTLIGISVGILTKNPMLAMAIAGGGGSAFQTGSTYGEAMDKLQAQGYSQDDAHRKASFAATIDGILEGVGEALPLGLALKPGSQIMARLFETMVAEAGQEAATQAMQDFNAYLSYDPNITLQEAWENMKVAALAGAMGGAVYGAAGHAVAASQERALERARPGITEDQSKSIRDQVSALNGPGNVMEPLNAQMARGAVTTRSDVSAPTIGGAPGPVEPSGGPVAAPAAPQPAAPSAPAPAGGAQEPPQEGQQPMSVEDMEKEAARRAEMTHRLDDGTLAEPYVSAEDGKPVAGFWRTPDGTVVEAARGEPLQKQETNGVWDVDGTKYDVTVIGKGREKGTARLADGQEIPIQQLAELDDEARLALGMKIEEPAAGNKKKPATTPATPSETPAAPAAKGGETESPPPRGSAAPEGAAGAPPTGQASTPPGREAEQKAFVSAYTKQGVPEEGARMLHRRAQEAANKTGKAQVLWQAPNGPLAIQPEGQAPVFKDGEVVATIEPSEAVLAKKDERKAKASERMTKRADERRRINVETDTLVQAIIKMGGISKEYQLDISGDIPFVGTLFRAGGDSPDGLGRRLAQYGYLTDAEAEDPKIVSDRIREELNGTRQYYSQMSRTGERQAREEMERRRPGYQEDRNLVDDALEASDDTPLELDYPPEELEAAGLEVTGETLAIVDLMSQLPEAERERMAIRGESLSEKQLLEELTKIVREDNRGRETEAGPNSQRGEQRRAAPSERAAAKGTEGAESAGGATAARGSAEGTAEEQLRASDRPEAGDRLEQAAASYEVGQWTGKPIVGTIKWDVSPKKRGARILATGSVNGKVVVRVVRPEYNVVTLDIDGWTFGEGYRPNYNNAQRAQLVAERIIRPEPTRRVEEPGADYEIHPKKGYETAEQWVGRMRASHPNDWVEVANKTIAEMERTYGERATRYHELKGSVGEGARTMDLRDFNARITELRAAVHRVAMRAEQKTPEYKTARFAESGWDFQKTFPRPHADSRYAADAEEGGAPAIAAMHEAIGEQLFRDLARIAYYGEALQRGEIAGKKLTPKRREEIQQGLSYLARDGDGLVSEYEMAFGHEAGEAFFDPIRARAAEAGKSAQFALDMQTPPQAKANVKVVDPANIPDPTNDEAIYSEPDATLILIACSDTKGPAEAALFNLYQGPVWHTLRAHLGAIPRSNVVVLSGKHGWQTSGARSEPYNERLTKQTADELVMVGLEGQQQIKGLPKTGGPRMDTRSALSSKLPKGPFKNVVMVGGKEYRRVMHAVVTQMDQAGMLDARAAIPDITGGIGEQRHQLGEILQAINEGEEEHEVETVQPGEKGLQRQREDKSIKKYLSAKRPGENDTERIISYRTEATVGYNKAFNAGAPRDIQDFLKGEHDWAMARLKVLSPETFKQFTPKAAAATLDLLGGSSTEPAGWTRHEHKGANKADYQLRWDGKDTGLWVRWVGHPTAHYSYFVESALFDVPQERGNGVFRTAKDAQEWALAAFLKWRDAGETPKLRPADKALAGVAAPSVPDAVALPPGVGPEEKAAAIRDRNEAILTPPEGTAPPLELKPQPTQQQGLFGPEVAPEMVRPAGKRAGSGNPSQLGLFDNVEDAAKQTDKKPTQAEQLSGDYKKGRFATKAGVIAIETPAGTERVDAHHIPPEWRTLMRDHYGEFERTVGFDKDRLDVFVKPGTTGEFAGPVYVVNQVRPDGNFDEHKVMYGYASPAEARAAYLANYPKGWKGLESMQTMTQSGFLAWSRDTSYRGPKGGILSFTEAIDRDLEAANAANTLSPAPGGTAPEQGGATAQRDLLLATAVPGTQASTLEKVVVEPVEHGSITLPHGEITTPVQAAQAFRHLETSPSEKMQMIGTDAAGRPIAYFEVFSGTLASVNAFPREVILLSAQTPGVTKVWLAHNHPSGEAQPSSADISVTKNFARGFGKDIGITLEGHLVIAAGEASMIDEKGTFHRFKIGKPPQGGIEVPIIERKVTRTDAGMKINSPSASRAMAKLLDLSPPGLMLLDAQRRLVGYWPMSVREMSVLRTGDLASGAARLFRQMGRNNVAAVVANLSKYKLSPAVQYAVENVGAALDVLGIEVIDALANDQNGNVTSFAERGHTLVNPDGFYALGAGAGTAPERVQAELKDDKLAKAMGGRLHVAASALELPEYAVADLKERGALADVRGYFDSMTGHVWLVSSNISPGEAQATLVHEMVGHVGLQQVLGPKFMDRMLEIYESRKGDIMGEANSGFLRPYAFDLRNRTHRATAAAEWIAHKAEAGEEQTLWQKVVAWIRAGLRELGIVRHYSDNDILELLRRSRSSLEHGGLDTYNGEPTDGPSPVDAFEPENITPGTLPEPTAKIEEAPAPSGKSEIQTKPGADFRRLNALLGAKLYGEPRDIAPVSVKEMVQNSFDAIKALIDKGQVRTGSIDIKVDWNERTITVSDNGSGMRPETLATTFLRIASTEKETTRSSGGLGIAKGLFLYGNKRIRVETIRDGKLAVLDTSGPELEAAAAGQGEAPTVKVSPAPGGLEHGTTVKVWIPADFIDTRSGEKVAIHLPDDPQYYKVLQNSPLFSNIHVGFNGKPMPNMGATFPANEYSVFARVQFHFGDATIYVTKKETPIENYTDNVHFLSNGLWQFSSGLMVNPFEIGGKRIPRRFYIDVHPKVEPEDSAYPFDLNRQRFTTAAGKDFDRVLIYATLAYRRDLMAKSAANFGQIHYLDQGRPTAPQTLAPPFDPAEAAKLLRVLEGDNVEVREGKLFVNGRSVPAIKREDMERATLDLTKYRVDQNEIDEDKVMVHDNTRTRNGESFTEAMRRELGPEFDHFMQGIGLQFIELRDAIADAYPNKYIGLSNSAVGMSFDKTYHGVNISVPFRGVFVNPASFSNIEDLVVLGNEIFGTMVHELVHEAEKGHNADFVNELQRMYSDILSSSHMEAIRKKVISLVEQHDRVVAHITGAFSDANLSNAGQSLEGKGKTGSRGATEGAPGRSEGPGGERVHGEAGLGAGSLERGAVSNVFSRGRQEPVGYYSLRSDGPRGTNEVYGVRDGRLLGYARRAYQGGIWDVFLANGVNESLFARGQFRREQAANVTEVQRIFNRAGLELRIIKPRNIPIPERTIFDRDWVAPEADSWVRRSVIYFQNRLLLPELYEGAIERAVGAIPEEAKAHREARLAHPRAAGKIADFDHDYTDRIVQVMRRARLSMKEVGLYLYARHAAERNAAIEAKNPENAAGSGMPTYRAEQLLEMFQATDARWAELQQIGAVVDEINRFREQVLIDKGLAPREAVELLRKYAHYVPLKDLIEDEFAQSEVGGGYQVGQLMHTAFGRFTEAQAEFILPGLIGQAKGTISAGENAEVLRTFLRQVEFAPNPDVWDVRRVEYKPRIDPETGMVQWAPQPVRKDSRNIISVPVNGKRVFVKVKDDRLARAYNSSGLPLVDSLKLIGTVTRFYALMATAANPEFVMTNAMRDFQQAMLRLTGEHNPEMAARVAKDMLPALWGAFSGLRAEGQYRPGESALPLAENWHAWYRRYIEAGGHIAYRGLADTETQHKEFLTKLAERGIYPENASKIEQFRLRAHRAAKVSGAKFFSQLIVDANGAVENALRLAAFKNAVQMGFTEKDAAMLARSVTVDFNLRGEAGSRIGALYMFFNANMQGTALLWRSVSRNRYMQGLAFMLFLMGLASDWWNSHWAEEGPDGRNAYDNISAAVKERNWIIMAPDRQNAITIAMPFGFNVFPLIGSNLGAVLRGAKKPLDAAQSIFVAAVNAFSPFGQSPTSWLGTLQLLSPTITDPAVQAITNRNFMEQAIVPERPRNASPQSPPQSDAATYFAGTPDVYVGVAQWLNEATGGNDVRSGLIDWSPNMLQHWVRSIFGSAGAFYARVVEAVHGAVADTPTEIEPRNIPFVRRFYYEPRDYELSRRFYENVRDAEVAHYEVRRAFEAGRPELGRALREEFQREREMFGEAEAVERQVSELRSQVSRIRRHPTMSDEQKKLAIEKLQEQSRGAMMRFNKRFEDRTAR